MNCCVPEFALEDDSSIFPSSSSFVRRIPDSAREDIVELLWQHGPVFRRRSPLVSPHGDTSLLPSCTDTSVSGATSDSVATTTTAVAPADLFMEEDEMASWLNYPLGDDDFTGGFGGVGANYFPEKAQAGAAVVPPDRSCQLPKADRRAGVGGWAASARPPLPPETRGKVALFPASRASTVVDSSVTPGRAPLESMVSSGGGGERGLTSSSGVVGQGEAATKAAARPDDRKRKATEADDSDSHSEDADFESSDKKDDTRRSTTTKRRPRAAEVHNLSERRRRDRINEKMRALQQLIPRCNKSDKASMLDDAIEYLKSLQMQVQMMSMGCNMVPVMFPGIQQYMPPVGMAMPMGMSMGMGLGMGMDMNAGALNHPMMPFLQVMSSSHMVPTGAAPLNHGLPMQAFHAPAVAFPDQVKLQATGQAVPASNRACPPAPKAAQVTNHPDLCQQYIGFHQLQVHPQNQASTKQGTNKGTGMPEKSKTG